MNGHVGVVAGEQGACRAAYVASKEKKETRAAAKACVQCRSDGEKAVDAATVRMGNASGGVSGGVGMACPGCSGAETPPKRDGASPDRVCLSATPTAGEWQARPTRSIGPPAPAAPSVYEP